VRNEERRPRILVSNDDGVSAPGIVALTGELDAIGHVTTVAPSRERSAAGHSLTLDVPLRATRLSDKVFSVDGTPTDCVLLAVRKLLPEKPDILVSGINRGPNMGHDITYSGTVAAAMEGTILGIPSIAVSMDRASDGIYDYSFAAAVARRVTEMVLDRGLPEGALLNVNVPNLPAEAVRGARLARLGKQVYEDAVVQNTDPRGRFYYWIGGQETTWAVETDTDFAAVDAGYVSITPIHLDLTDYATMEKLADWPHTDIVSSAAGSETAPSGPERPEEDPSS